MSPDALIFLDVAMVLDAHALGIAMAGGEPGLRDRGLLESAVLAARSGYYESVAEIAAVYLHGVVKNHAFLDGNKRAAALSALAFLDANGFAPAPLAFPEWLTIVERVATGTLKRSELTPRIAAVMPGGDPVAFD